MLETCFVFLNLGHQMHQLQVKENSLDKKGSFQGHTNDQKIKINGTKIIL